MRLIKRILAERRSKYQFIEVVEFFDIGKALIIDGKIQSAACDEHVYHEALVHPAMLLHPKPSSVLIVGGGEGATLREVLKHRTVLKVTMVDLDRDVIELAKEHLREWHQGAFHDPRVKLVIDDGRRFLERVEEKFDVIILDVVDPQEGGPGYMLYTKEFYERVADTLRSPGVVVTQAASPSYSPEVFAIIYRTMKSVFDHVYPYMVFIKSFNSPWGFMMASNGLQISELEENLSERLRTRLEGQLRFYDEETHKHMFSLPKDVREALRRETRVATDDNPVFMPA
ncbi:TPA: polyamine aminopropyltransferase [Candidatus Micrarchaeota archaeon]|nr:polyamine aminopropyltransferase [Candidatus Micrarchaeota archaeon]